ncbi:MAG: hypothetical protein HFE63_01490 [Clostridiales bacterium]|nr:hypothetical protein [Clostridiales bacterium]
MELTIKGSAKEIADLAEGLLRKTGDVKHVYGLHSVSTEGEYDSLKDFVKAIEVEESSKSDAIAPKEVSDDNKVDSNIVDFDDITSELEIMKNKMRIMKIWRTAQFWGDTAGCDAEFVALAADMMDFLGNLSLYKGKCVSSDIPERIEEFINGFIFEYPESADDIYLDGGEFHADLKGLLGFDLWMRREYKQDILAAQATRRAMAAKFSK